jgi:hypothetical protein
MRKRGQRGAVLLESVMTAPILIMLLMGTIEFGRLAYIYVALEKVLYHLARSAASQPGLNFCGDADTALQALKDLAVSGSPDGAGTSLVSGLTASMISIRPERMNAGDQTLYPCDCSTTGCDTANGGLPPDFIVAEIPDGYSIRPLFFGFSVDPILLRPHVRVPNGGA